ncbi:hypothetical protein [Intestinibacillus massiliensis]|uniref:hypothetical protein n=1 Tax=Intestinibacillus massiliensis TaxID=1871029 RepID=UPI000B34BC91|nr:hypothetical protein [Intestinibacillus massiliensis]
MLGKQQQDFSYYSHEFKDNYRKGVFRLRAILGSRTQAEQFCGNAGGVSVILAHPAGHPDRNSGELYSILTGSPYCDAAVQTFMLALYPACADDNALYGDRERAEAIYADPIMSRAVGAGRVSAGKWIATLASQNCNSFEDINAVAASSTAMGAVAASSTAMGAVAASSTAMGAVAASSTAMGAVAASSTAMGAVAASWVAIAAIHKSAMAYKMVAENESAWAAFIAADGIAVGKAVVSLAGLDPTDYADLQAVCASELALQAVCASELALQAVCASELALQAVCASELALQAVCASELALQAVCASSLAVAAVWGNTLSKDKFLKDSRLKAKLTGVTGDVGMLACAKLSGLDIAKYADGKAVVADYSAIVAIFNTPVAREALSATTAAAAVMAAAGGVAIGKAAVKLAGLNPDNFADVAAVAASSTAMQAVAASGVALNAVLKNDTARTKLAGSSYLNAQFDKMLSTVNNTTYFSKSFSYIDSGAKRAIANGTTDSTPTPNQSVFLCKKIGAWSNGTNVTGTANHLQTGTAAGSATTSVGGGKDTDDYTTGGVQAKCVCIGGGKFTETGDAYCNGIFAYAI